MEELKELCYDLLGQNMNKIAGSEIKIILVDFNIRFGKENLYKPTTGNGSLYNKLTTTKENRISLRYLKV